MKSYIVPSLRMLAFMTLLTGVLYPVGITLLSLGIFPYQANGSMMGANGAVIGSELIGQGFTSDKYFHSRPSGIAYNPTPSSGTNWGPTDRRMADSATARISLFSLQNHLSPGMMVPNEMLFASGSGVDPHISPESALMQADRVARVRGFDGQKTAALKQLIRHSSEQAQFALFGNPRINVLKLNLALDSME